jgi:hypothetical protein
LLDLLEIKGCIITIDAMGCQKKIVEKIIKEKKADYVIALKGNQGTLHGNIKLFFEGALKDNFDMLRHEKSSKVGIKNKRLTAAWLRGFIINLFRWRSLWYKN